jgi:hypothetical protein
MIFCRARFWQRQLSLLKQLGQGRTQRGRGAGQPPPPQRENYIYYIFRMTLWIILWVFGTFFGI